jgi:hypothetical protein
MNVALPKPVDSPSIIRLRGMKLSQAYLKEILHYDPETGIWTWKVSRGRVKVSQRAGSYDYKNGPRWVISIDRKNYLASRLAWFYVTGEWPVHEIDHKNRNPADNRWENLREATRQQNSHNQSKRKTNTSGLKGVRWKKANQKWRAEIRVDGKSVHLGYFDSKEQASAAYRDAARQLHGEFFLP